MSNVSFAEKTSFSTVCNVLEQISKMKNRKEKEHMMSKFISSFHEKKTQKDESFYPIFRLLLPQLEKERSSYGIKETVLARIYTRILCLSDQSKDAQKLKNYKSTSGNDCIGDFADVVFWILKSRFSEKGNLPVTVHQVNSHLDNIAAKKARGDPRGVDAELQAIIVEMSPMEQKWLVRILLKDLRLNLSTKKMLAMFHPDANDLFDACNNLLKVCSMLKDPSVRINEIGVDVFQAFKPMLCRQCDVQNVITEIRGAEAYYVEIKFDGERFQLHFKDGEFKYFSRNGHEYSDCFGCNSSNGILTPRIVKNLRSNVKSCILDGEMMCWNTLRKGYTTKGNNIDVKTLKQGHVNQPCFVVFDILLLNGRILTNEPLMERFKILEEIIQPEEGVLIISAKQVVSTGNEILNLLNQSIENYEEGIVVKDPASVYKFNARNAGWYKIKPEYTEGMMVELDLIIIGGYYGDGRRRGVVSQFLLGVAASEKNENNEPTTFYPVVKIGSGYSDDELEDLNRKLKNFWKHAKGTQKPVGMEWTREKPDVWIKPSDSFILQVKATELMPSDSFKVGYTLRFPRVEKIRYDKPWYNCLTIDDFSALRQANCGKLTASYTVKLNEESSSKKKIIKRTIKKPSLDESSSAKKIRNEEMISALFQNKEICVITGVGDTFSKNDLEVAIMQHGGTVVQHPGSETFCVIADENNVRVANIARLKKYDVVKPIWLLDCIDKNVLRKWRPDDLLVMSPSTSEMFSLECDSFGDSYTEKIDPDRLGQLMDSVKVNVNDSISLKDMLQLDKELFGGKNPFAIFRGCFAFFHNVYESYDEKYEAPVLKAMFRFYNGIIKSEIDRDTTHIITFGSIQLPDELRRKVSKKIRIVSSKWITESWKAQYRLRTSPFISSTGTSQCT